MNFLLDATLGMLVIWLAVKLTSKLVEYKQWTLLTFGEYGETQTGPFLFVEPQRLLSSSFCFRHQRAVFTQPQSGKYSQWFHMCFSSPPDVTSPSV